MYYGFVLPGGSIHEIANWQSWQKRLAGMAFSFLIVLLLIILTTRLHSVLTLWVALAAIAMCTQRIRKRILQGPPVNRP
jgi:hypothetical protein